jgi:hypothetical protein
MNMSCLESFAADRRDLTIITMLPDDISFILKIEIIANMNQFMWKIAKK